MVKNTIYIRPQNRITIRPIEHDNCTIITMAVPDVITIKPKKRIELKPPKKSNLWKEFKEIGWSNFQNGFRGKISGNIRSYKALIYTPDWKEFTLFIKNPSDNLLRGSKKFCIRKHTTEPWYWIHFNNGQNNPLGQIIALQEYMKGVGE